MNTAYLLLGANKGDKFRNMEEAFELVEEKAGKCISSSSTYETAAWGNREQPDFLNRVMCIETLLSPIDLLRTVLLIEEQLGRIRTEEKWQERIMDIDILFYNHEVIDLHELQVPHPFLHERKFVLIPLSEIAPQLEHPLLKKTITELLLSCADELEVKKQS
ncbi:MAG: 2-amino-4-hydroxy-6-hydroxymethyldihydropteridine diphosphokinase [Bacteroidota bacterium]|nr:2-amino-4-hydroxy-6-hydroxymethyldihydropteridine diphosphokinase [Bacteroidota bacterium]